MLNASTLSKTPCVHDSLRVDGTLDHCCLRCGVTGYWSEGFRHDEVHPSGKLLFRLPALTTKDSHGD